MNIRIAASEAAAAATAPGQPVPRREDPILLAGRGRYSDDVRREGQLHAAMVRSRHAHGRILAIDTAAALAVPGVVAVLTGADLARAGLGGLKCQVQIPSRDGQGIRPTPRMALAEDRVRFVGDPLACVVAETGAAARDGAEAVHVEIEPLEALVRPRAALAPGAPRIWDEVPDNLALDFHFGDAARVAEAFAAAHHVTRLDLVNNRIVVNAMEPRAALAEYDAAAERWTLHVGCQGVFGLRNQIARDILRVPPERVRILTGHVGGSFGMKASAYPEYVCLLHAARELGRPVKWVDERSESFVSDQHGRDHEVRGELALDEEGRILALRIDVLANMGAYLATVGPLAPTQNVVKNVASLYRVPLLEVSSRCVLTNTTPVSAYRGAGRPESNYYMERLLDQAARELGLDRAEIRRRNHLRASEMPYRAASGQVYDSGDFPAVFARALELADWQGFAARKAESARRGLLRGIGIGHYLEVTAPPAREMGGIRFEANGEVTIVTGTLDYGQGHWTPFAQVLADRLGLPFARIRLLQGDSDALIAGGGTGGSKSMMASGAAIVEAAARVIEQGREVAAHLLEAASADIEFAAGRFRIAGTDRSIGLLELAARLREGLDLPEGLPRTLDVRHVFEAAPSAFPNGCHVAEVEIDPETGEVRVVRYSAVNDFGTLINPMLVEGQVHGGVAQGLGQALMERTVHDAEGQLLSGSFMDYAMPRADSLPDIVQAHHPVPATTNPLGVKGCGEAGCAGSLPAIMNAVTDALAERGVLHIDMPATPLRIWEALRAAR
ncbi:MAG: xanthine dehydrogenase family protein molybdopterin-binding subunit [Alphaproteobacteria bacterium]|nr:xanthine dehydrogenase family protein molybdopterin-binding subunit [Alphaproteobacteria bacterium]